MTQQLALDIDLVADTEMKRARDWRAANPRGYGAIVAWAHEDAARRGRCAMQRYFEALRDPEFATRFVHRSDAIYLLNHNLRAALTRLIRAEYPGLPFHTRRSKCDPGCLPNETPGAQPW